MPQTMPMQNWWEGNAFMMPQFTPRPRYRPVGQEPGIDEINPLARRAAETVAPWLSSDEAGPYSPFEAATPLNAENRFGEMRIPGWARAGLGVAGMAFPPISPLTAGIGLLSRAANTNANELARGSIGLPGLNIGQALGGIMGMNRYGSGLDTIGLSALGTEPGLMSPAGAAAAGIQPNTPAYAQALGVANVPGGAGTGTTGQDEGQSPDSSNWTWDDVNNWSLSGIEPFRAGGQVQDDRDSHLEEVPAVLHEGEFVIRPEAVKMYGRELLDALNEGRVPAALAKGWMG